MVLKKKSDELDFKDPTAGPVLSARFALCVLLFVVGIAWIAVYYVFVRPEPGGDPTGPSWLSFMGDLKRWNYVIGFGLVFLGLALSAHPATPLGRGRGVVVGMLGCFLVGLVWICTFYVISDDISRLPVFDDLGQYNLVVGIALMAVGFTFATKWE